MPSRSPSQACIFWHEPRGCRSIGQGQKFFRSLFVHGFVWVLERKSLQREVYTKKRASFSARRPVFDAIASKFSISLYPIMPALQLKRFSFDSISLERQDFESALGEVLPLILALAS